MDIYKCFNEYMTIFDAAKYLQAYQMSNNAFQKFWNNTILNKSVKKISEEDVDPIIRLLDTHAKGHTKDDIAVASTFIRQNMWYRMFFDLKEKPRLAITLDQVFKESEKSIKIELLNKLFDENKNNKNGLTGNSGNILNTLLFINNPDEYLDVCSIAHRKLIIEKYNMGVYDDTKSFGERVINSNDIILSFFRNLNIKDPPFCIGFFLCRHVKDQWINKEVKTEEIIEKESSKEEEENLFRLEKHFEDFLIANWEKTDLGKKYDLIIENGEKIVSQQYRTDIGPIDILVTEKTNRNNYVVIELKRNQSSDDTCGQLLRYMGWVKKNLAKDGMVKGVVIAHECDEKLKYSVFMVPNVELFKYQVSFSIVEEKLV